MTKQAKTEWAAYQSAVAQAKRIDSLQNEGGYGYQTADNIVAPSDMVYYMANGWSRDETATKRAAWNDAAKGMGAQATKIEAKTGIKLGELKAAVSFWSQN
jgi:hypothetical protein